jgi:hypothetical protein
MHRQVQWLRELSLDLRRSITLLVMMTEEAFLRHRKELTLPHEGHNALLLLEEVVIAIPHPHQLRVAEVLPCSKAEHSRARRSMG